MTDTVPEQYVVQFVDLSKIYADDSFNCRGEFGALEVQDVVQSIRDRGLDTPIVLQPACDVPGGLPPGMEFRIVAGHRREMSFRVLNRTEPNNPKWQKMPAFIRAGLSEIDARLLNLSENLDRKDLNILQEANAIKALFDAGMPRDAVAGKVKKSSGWVQTRFNLLSLPPEIQLEAAAGLINQLQIKQLYSLETVEEQYEMVKKIKEARQKGEKVEHAGKKKKVAANVKKERKKDEIFAMMEVLAKSIGYGIHTRFGAWITASISTEEFFEDVRKVAADQGKLFIPPLEF